MPTQTKVNVNKSKNPQQNPILFDFRPETAIVYS